MAYENIGLVNNQPNHNFELVVDGHRAFIDYKQKGNKMYLIHTEVPAELKGKGVAEAIVEKALAYLEANQFVLVPLCSYVQTFLKRHPEWNRLLSSPPAAD